MILKGRNLEGESTFTDIVHNIPPPSFVVVVVVIANFCKKMKNYDTKLWICTAADPPDFFPKLI